MNKQTYPSLLAAAVLLMAIGPLSAQDTFFFTDFEYDIEPFPDELVSAADLNGAIDQVGEWSGDDFPDGDPSSAYWFSDDDAFCCGFDDNPLGGRLLFIDRPVANATHFANLTEEIPVIGTEVSIVLGTRRTGGGFAKDYDIFGVDSNGNESFRLRVGADGARERLGYVTDNGATAIYDLPTLVGEDAVDDLANTGGPPFDEGDLSTITVNLGTGGYVVDFENSQNAYSTDFLANNGSATTLAQVGIFYQGVVGATGSQSGFFIDTLGVTRADILFGDFDSNGMIEMADFLLLANNYGTGTTYAEGDINFDRQVNLSDFSDFVRAFNAQGQAVAAAVPEPSSVILVTFGAMVLVVGRRGQRRRTQ